MDACKARRGREWDGNGHATLGRRLRRGAGLVLLRRRLERGNGDVLLRDDAMELHSEAREAIDPVRRSLASERENELVREVVAVALE